MSSNGEDRPTASRWWEYYLVRYATGTVVGAVMVHFLFQHVLALQPFMSWPDDLSKLKSIQALLLGAFGLTFSYIASAPMLVLHATRYSIDMSRPHMPLGKWGAYLAIAFTVFVAIFLATDKFAPASNRDAWVLSIWGTVLFFAFLVPQLVLVFKALSQTEKLYAFYKLLANKRAKAKAKEGGDIVESYRHLREHGNAFAIVFLEAALGTILYALGATGSWLHRGLIVSQESTAAYLIVLFLWIFPAAMVWLVATGFERRFSMDHS